MKYVYPFLNERFDFEDGRIHTLILENPEFFREILTDFQMQIDGKSGKGVLSVSDTPVDMMRNAEVLDSFVPFELNRKSLVNKIVAALEKNAVSPDHYEKSMRLLNETENYLEQIAFDFSCDVMFPKLSVGAIIKCASPELRDEYTDLCEKVLDYFELVCEFDRPKLFVTVNFRSYISDRDFELFAGSVLSHGYSVLMIENFAKKPGSLEKRLIIDQDLCEIG